MSYGVRVSQVTAKGPSSGTIFELNLRKEDVLWSVLAISHGR